MPPPAAPLITQVDLIEFFLLRNEAAGRYAADVSALDSRCARRELRSLRQRFKALLRSGAQIEPGIHLAWLDARGRLRVG